MVGVTGGTSVGIGVVDVGGIFVGDGVANEGNGCDDI